MTDLATYGIIGYSKETLVQLSIKNRYDIDEGGVATIYVDSVKYGTQKVSLLTKDLIEIDQWASQSHVNAKGEWSVTLVKGKGSTFYASIGILNPKGGWRVDAQGRHRRKTSVKVHRLIMKPDDGLVVDHIDGNGLNNLRENLRVCTNAENSRNARQYKKTASKFKGVSRADSKSKPWKARLKYNYKEVHIGIFKTQEEAARAYDEKAKELFGEFAHLNFPEEENTIDKVLKIYPGM